MLWQIKKITSSLQNRKSEFNGGHDLITIRNAEQIPDSYLREAKRWESSDENRPLIRNYHIFAES